MDRSRAAFLWALSAGAVAPQLVPEGESGVSVLVALLGTGVVVALMIGDGRKYLLLYLGDAIAAALGTRSPTHNVLIQPVIAGMPCRTDAAALLVGGATTIMANAGALVFHHTPYLLLAFLPVSAGMASGPTGFEAGMHPRMSTRRTA